MRYQDKTNHKSEIYNARHTGPRHAAENQRMTDTQADLWHLWARVDSSSITQSL